MTAGFLSAQLEEFYGDPVPEVDLIDYELRRCTRCTLEFAEPMVPGSERFYQWIIHQPNYYPSYRWEWGKSLDIVRSSVKQGAAFFEVGCGNGDFLRYLTKHKTSGIGVDTSPAAINVAQVRALDAHCLRVEDYLAANPSKIGTFDAVVSFHCLEHVDKPLDFVRSMKSLMSSSGRLMLSTPYSPMSYESMWYDPLNHPPHHSTRWNFKAYEELAGQLGMKVRFHFPDADSTMNRTLRALCFRLNGFRWFVSRRQMLFYSLKNPMVFIKEYRSQLLRDASEGRVAADVVLVELRS